MTNKIGVVLAFLEFLSTVQSSLEFEDEQERLQEIKESLMTLFHISPFMLEGIPNVLRHGGEQNERSTMQLNGPLNFLFQHFHLVVEKLGVFYSPLLDQDYLSQKSLTMQTFMDAIAVLKEAGHVTFDRKKLAYGINIMGNKIMNFELYNSAIDLYSIANALSKDNAIYLCNRAAALTKIEKYEEAIRDCYEAITLNLRYVMAYYRLGCAYYEQGKNLESIREGFLKVLELEPNNKDAMVCLQLANSRIEDEVASVREKIGKLRAVDGAPPSPVTGNRHPSSPRQSTVLVFRGVEEGGNGP